MAVAIYKQSPAPEQPPLLVDSKTAARMLSICTKTLWQMTREGELPCLRVGRRTLYSPAKLQAWIDTQATANTPADKGGAR
ncbi:MAG: helix-turn-helix domain-containing protein [Pirellulales bacterium]|nr:helix-turn-helix domain-containing protein [Pirellulales bacterium]